MLHSRIFFRGRWVDQITSEEGQRQYYDLFDCWRTGVSNHNPLIKPTVEEAKEYLHLKAIRAHISCCGTIEERKAYKKYKLFDTRYDWRPFKSEKNGLYGLVAPDGTNLLPEKFVDIFTNFDAINHPLPFIPVYNGNCWALVSSSNPPILMTDFIYNAILPEHYDHSIYFVQDKKSMKWGSLKVGYGYEYKKNRERLPKSMHIPLLKELMPPVADEIYEDELWGDCENSLFWMTRNGDKIGILTPYGFSKIEYDYYETDDEMFRIRLIKGKEVKLLNYGFLCT